jgi:hypothetical protein
MISARRVDAVTGVNVRVPFGLMVMLALSEAAAAVIAVNAAVNATVVAVSSATNPDTRETLQALVAVLTA